MQWFCRVYLLPPLAVVAGIGISHACVDVKTMAQIVVMAAVELTIICDKGGATEIVLVLQPHATEDVNIGQT